MSNMNYTKNSVHLLTSREIGLQTAAENTTEIVSSRFKSLRITNFFISCVPDQEMTVANCNFIRKDCKNGDILGIWDVPLYSGIAQKLSMQFGPHCSKEDSSSLVSNVQKVNPHCTIRPVIDACFYTRSENDRNSIAYITPHSTRYRSLVTFMMYQDETDEHLPSLEYGVNDQVFSCAYNSNTNVFIAGSCGKMYIFNSCLYSSCKLVTGNLACVEFNESGDTVYIGDAFEGLRTCDMRSPSSFLNSLLYPGEVSNLKLLTNENEIVLNNSNKIIKVDLRTNKCLLDYKGTIHYAAKISLSVEENADILCSSSLNNNTQLWCLSTGKLLYSIPPYLANTTARSCLVSSGNRWGVALFQKNCMLILEP